MVTRKKSSIVELQNQEVLDFRETTSLEHMALIQTFELLWFGIWLLSSECRRSNLTNWRSRWAKFSKKTYQGILMSSSIIAWENIWNSCQEKLKLKSSHLPSPSANKRVTYLITPDCAVWALSWSIWSRKLWNTSSSEFGEFSFL